jgi:hypothetical protein
MPNNPFCVLGLPRSRTAWLANFLSYGDRECRHEGTATMGSFDEVLATLRAGVGLSDTMLGLRAEDIARALPATRMVVVRRDIAQVRASMARIGYPMAGHFLEHLAQKLDRASWLPHAIVVRFEELNDKATCAWIFRHCLGETMPGHWWDLWGHVNVQTDAKSVIDAGTKNMAGLRTIYGPAL